MIDKRRVWELLEPAGDGDRMSRVVDLVLIFLIVFNVIGVALGSVPSVYRSAGPYLDGFEALSVAVFTVEYLGRMWSCTATARYAAPVSGRIRFFFRPLILVDLLAILPFYLPFLGVDLRTMRAFRIFRILRILKLARYSHAFYIIQRAISGKLEELLISGLILFVLLAISSSIMFLVERESQPEVFSSIPATLWWSVVTLTTVGYGDIYPVTTLGKIIAGLISILGVGMVALPAGIISAGFVDEFSRYKSAKCDDGDICPTCGRPYDEERTEVTKTNRDDELP